MSDDSRANPSPKRTNWTTPLLLLALIGLMIVVTGLLSQRVMERMAAESRLASETDRAATVEADLREEIENLKKTAAQREAETAAREAELRQREAAIAGREDAAAERTQSSFQGLLIQQQMMKNLESLKASLPDLTPEVERLAREHAQSQADRQRLQNENAELRRKVPSPTPPEGR